VFADCGKSAFKKQGMNITDIERLDSAMELNKVKEERHSHFCDYICRDFAIFAIFGIPKPGPLFYKEL
jgi:hypothetical protein